MQLRIESMLTFEAPFLDLSVTIENIKFNTMLFDKRGIYAFLYFTCLIFKVRLHQICFHILTSARNTSDSNTFIGFLNQFLKRM